jgi:hypothetical protein
MGCHELAEHVLLLLLLVGGQSQCFLALIEPAGNKKREGIIYKVEKQIRENK